MAAHHPDDDLGLQVSMALIALASWIVPCDVRSDWRHEWEAEVWHRWDRLRRWAAVDARARLQLWCACSGAFADALSLRGVAAAESAVLEDVRCGMRMLVESPRRTLGAGLPLAVGLGVTSALLALALPALLGGAPVAAPERLVTIRNTYSAVDRPFLPVSAPEYDVYRRQSSVFEDAAASYVKAGVVTHAGVSCPARIATVSPNFFELLGARPLLGDTSRIGDGRVAVLAYDLWQTRFGGDAAVVGDAVSAGAETLTVVAVMPRDFDLPGRADLWWPRDPNDAPPAASGPDNRFLDVVGRLRPGVTPETAQRAMSDLCAQLKPPFGAEAGPQWGISVGPFEPGLSSESRAPLVALLACAATLLALACASAASRLHSAAVSPDASRRSRLRRQITHGVLLASGGAALGLAVAIVALPWLGEATARLTAGRGVALDGRAVATVSALALVCGLAVGVAPVLARSRRVLATVQVALALALTAGACAAVVRAERLRAAEPGFEPAGRLTYKLALDASGSDLVAAYDIALSRARGLGGVGVVAAADALPLDGGAHDRSLLVEAAYGRTPADHECRSVSPCYFDVMGIPLLEGRAFLASDRPGAPGVAVVNEAFARRYWPGECAVGRRVRLVTPQGERWRTVVGVVGDVRQRRLDEAPLPEIYFAFPQLPTRSISVVATAPSGAEPAIRAGLASIESRQLSSDVRQLADVVDRAVAPRAELAIVMGVLAAIAFALAVRRPDR